MFANYSEFRPAMPEPMSRGTQFKIFLYIEMGQFIKRHTRVIALAAAMDNASQAFILQFFMWMCSLEMSKNCTDTICQRDNSSFALSVFTGNVWDIAEEDRILPSMPCSFEE